MCNEGRASKAIKNSLQVYMKPKSLLKPRQNNLFFRKKFTHSIRKIGAKSLHLKISKIFMARKVAENTSCNCKRSSFTARIPCEAFAIFN